jgi:hypothetical protein
MSTAVTHIQDAQSTKELARLRADLESMRAYFAGPCNRNVPTAPRCPRRHYDGHRHWNAWYEHNRGIVVMLNTILDGTYPRQLWDELATRIDPDEV